MAEAATELQKIIERRAKRAIYPSIEPYGGRMRLVELRERNEICRVHIRGPRRPLYCGRLSIGTGCGGKGMQRRRLGGLEVSAVGLGCATMTPF